MEEYNNTRGNNVSQYYTLLLILNHDYIKRALRRDQIM